jgi:hypothetical protein
VLCRSAGVEPCIDLIPALTLPFPPPLQLALARFHAARASAPAATRMAAPPPLRPRLRIAYASSHFSGSSIGREMLYVIGAHDRARVAIGCFALNAADESSALSRLWRSTIASACADGWVELSSLSDSAGALAINSAGTHVLLDLNGWSGGHRAAMLALRVAPRRRRPHRRCSASARTARATAWSPADAGVLSQPAALQVNYKNWVATAGAAYLGWIGADAVSIA